MTLSGLSNGGWSPKDQGMIRSVEFSTHFPFSRGGNGVKGIHHAYMMKPEEKIPGEYGVLGASSVGCGTRGGAGRVRVEALHPFPFFALRSLPSGCSTVSFIMPFNKLVNVFFRVLSAVLANNQIQKGSVLENF